MHFIASTQVYVVLVPNSILTYTRTSVPRKGVCFLRF